MKDTCWPVPADIEPRFQVTTDPERLPPPVTETRVVPGGRESQTRTPSARPAPVTETVSENVQVPPDTASAGPVFRITTWGPGARKLAARSRTLESYASSFVSAIASLMWCDTCGATVAVTVNTIVNPSISVSYGQLPAPNEATSLFRKYPLLTPRLTEFTETGWLVPGTTARFTPSR